MLCIHSSFNISPLTSRLFISPSIHLFIRPSTHSAGKAAVHPFIPLFIDAAATLPSHLIMHPSLYPSFHFPPFRPLRLLSISQSLRLRPTLSPLLPSFIYIGFFTPFQKNTVGEKGWGGEGVKLGPGLKDLLMSGCSAMGAGEGFRGVGGGGRQNAG